NNHGIGICLVGDFRRDLPSEAQLASLNRLLVYLMRKYDIPPECVIGHCDAPNANTTCPGEALHGHIAGRLRKRLARQLSAARRVSAVSVR
ncbi:MAG: N-acetylmuramoyl-L-alanine amidase, partial [Phycisphaerae bacterium]|nr:N-acetylmuramoyl-L-alanine amidase [Phycisphaerae bacterium]